MDWGYKVYQVTNEKFIVLFDETIDNHETAGLRDMSKTIVFNDARVEWFNSEYVRI